MTFMILKLCINFLFFKALNTKFFFKFKFSDFSFLIISILIFITFIFVFAIAIIVYILSPISKIFFIFLRFFIFLNNIFQLWFLTHFFSFFLDLLFFVHKFRFMLFWGVSYYDPLLKIFLDRASIVKGEVIMDFYNFSNKFIFENSFNVPVSIFSQTPLLEPARNFYLVKTLVNFQLDLLQINQKSRTFFYFFSKKQYLKELSFDCGLQREYSMQDSLRLFQKIFIYFKKFLFSFLFFFYSFFSLDFFVFLNRLHVVLLNNYSSSFLKIILLKYLSYLRLCFTFLLINFENDSFLNYIYVSLYKLTLNQYYNKKDWTNMFNTYDLNFTNSYPFQGFSKHDFFLILKITFFYSFIYFNYFLFFIFFFFTVVLKVVFYSFIYFSQFLNLFLNSHFFFGHFFNLFSFFYLSILVKFFDFVNQLFYKLPIILFPKFLLQFISSLFLNVFKSPVVSYFLIFIDFFFVYVYYYLKLLFSILFSHFYKSYFFILLLLKKNFSVKLLSGFRSKLLFKSKLFYFKIFKMVNQLNLESFTNLKVFYENSLNFLEKYNLILELFKLNYFEHFYYSKNLSKKFLLFSEFSKLFIFFKFLKIYFLFYALFFNSSLVHFKDLNFETKAINSMITEHFFKKKYINLFMFEYSSDFLLYYFIFPIYLIISFFKVVLLYFIYYFTKLLFEFFIFVNIIFWSIFYAFHFFIFYFKLLWIVFLFFYFLFFIYHMIFNMLCVLFYFTVIYCIFCFIYYFSIYIIKIFFNNKFFIFLFLILKINFLLYYYYYKLYKFLKYRNFGFVQISSIFFLVRNELKKYDFVHSNKPFSSLNSLNTDFLINNFLIKFRNNFSKSYNSSFSSSFFEFKNFRPKFISSYESLNVLKKKNLRNDFLKIQIKSDLFTEFEYHKYLRSRNLRNFNLFRFRKVIDPKDIYFDHALDKVSIFRSNSVSNNYFNFDFMKIFYNDDFVFNKEMLFFRKIFSKKNLSFFYDDLDTLSNFRVSFSKLSPIFRYFYLKREKMKYLFSMYTFGNINYFSFSILFNWLLLYRLLRTMQNLIFSLNNSFLNFNNRILPKLYLLSFSHLFDQILVFFNIFINFFFYLFLLVSGIYYFSEFPYIDLVFVIFFLFKFYLLYVLFLHLEFYIIFFERKPLILNCAFVLLSFFNSFFFYITKRALFQKFSFISRFFVVFICAVFCFIICLFYIFQIDFLLCYKFISFFFYDYAIMYTLEHHAIIIHLFDLLNFNFLVFSISLLDVFFFSCSFFVTFFFYRFFTLKFLFQKFYFFDKFFIFYIISLFLKLKIKHKFLFEKSFISPSLILFELDFLIKLYKIENDYLRSNFVTKKR